MPDSPNSLVLTVAAGAALANAGLLVGKHSELHFRRVSVVSFVCILAGLALLTWASHRLKESIRREKWSEASLRPMRSLVNNPGWRALTLLLFALMTVSLFLSDTHFGSFWCWLILFQVQLDLLGTFTVRKAPEVRVDWRKAVPLHSDHWGSGAS